jgi:hypothetical protein
MSLEIQTINVMTYHHERLSCTLPAEHVYPFIIHRCVSEYLEKKAGERTRYSKAHVVTHLLTGAQIGTFPNYNNALTFVRKLKNKPIFLMPTYNLILQHPDRSKTCTLVNRLKAKLSED